MILDHSRSRVFGKHAHQLFPPPRLIRPTCWVTILLLVFTSSHARPKLTPYTSQSFGAIPFALNRSHNINATMGTHDECWLPDVRYKCWLCSFNRGCKHDISRHFLQGAHPEERYSLTKVEAYSVNEKQAGGASIPR
jgi:hypothetical protein